MIEEIALAFLAQKQLSRTIHIAHVHTASESTNLWPMKSPIRRRRPTCRLKLTAPAFGQNPSDMASLAPSVTLITPQI